MKAGKTNVYVFVSPEIHEITASDGSTKPILTVPAYGTLYKTSRPTKHSSTRLELLLGVGMESYLMKFKDGQSKITAIGQYIPD